MIGTLFKERWVTNVFALIECVILAFIAVGGWRELSDLREQHRLERLIAGKTSVQEVNDLILKDREAIFVDVLYPGMPEGKAKKLTAAYASLHALEVLYLMQIADSPEDTPAFDKFLGEYLTNPAFHELWAFENFRLAFGRQFRKAVNEHISISKVDTQKPQ